MKNKNLITTVSGLISFKGLKSLTGKNYVERTIIKAIKNDVAIYVYFDFIIIWCTPTYIMFNFKYTTFCGTTLKLFNIIKDYIFHSAPLESVLIVPVIASCLSRVKGIILTNIFILAPKSLLVDIFSYIFYKCLLNRR